MTRTGTAAAVSPPGENAAAAREMAQEVTLKQLFNAAARFMINLQDRMQKDPFYAGMFSYWTGADDREKLERLTKTAKENASNHQAVFRYLRGQSKTPPEVPVACARSIIESAETMATIAGRFTSPERLAALLPERARQSADYETGYKAFKASSLAALTAPPSPAA